MANTQLTPKDITDRLTAVLMDRHMCPLTPWEESPIEIERISWSDDRAAVTLHLNNGQAFKIEPVSVPIGNAGGE